MDIYDTPHQNDIAFTPQGRLKWDQKRYDKKLHDLAEVLSHYKEHKATPDFIGLSEVENYRVIQDLISQPQLSQSDIYGNSVLVMLLYHCFSKMQIVFWS